jgi:hypothetical protein
MDTLVIVRKIREAETLADDGNHAEAVKLLKPLLVHDALSSAHRELIRKKIDVIEKQHQRATRLMTRGAERDEPTVVALAEPEPTERPTETAIEKHAEGEPTEAVPRFESREHDREKTRKRPMRKSDPSLPVSPDENATLRVPPPPGLNDASDTQQVPRPAQMPQPRIYDHIVDTSEHKLLPLDDEAEIEDETPVPTPADLTSGEHRKLAEVGIVPTPAPGPPALEKGKTEKIDEDQHFGRKSTTRKGSKSTPDLKALADHLPPDDMRRDLALEVVRLREELERSRRKPPTGPAPTRRSDRPESGKFHIPAGQANTIVRRAAGSESIEVHMPSRDENMPELQVLRRDSFRGKRAEDPAVAGQAAAGQPDSSASDRNSAGKLKPLIILVLALAALPVVAGLVYLIWNAVTAKPAAPAVVTETTFGDIALGAEVKAVEGLTRGSTGMLTSSRGWIVQAEDGKVVAVTAMLQGDHGVKSIAFGNRSMELADGTSATRVRQSMGEPEVPLDKDTLNSGAVQSLKYRDKQGRSVLEFLYRGDGSAVALRLYDESANPPRPELAPE